MTVQPKQIRGKVAQIINSREVALNLGSEHGVELNMLFDILTPKGYDIKDPDTGEVLGSVERPKTRVKKVVHVRERLSVASTYRKRRVNVGGSGIDIAALSRSGLFEPPKWETRYETLKTTETTWDELTEEGSYISTGDPVMQVFDDGEPPQN